jgi:predicted  nucleic acid-binding Zn-ribbon protein
LPTPTSSSADLTVEIAELECKLKGLTCAPVAVQQLQDAIAAKRAELSEFQKQDFAAAAERQHAQEQFALAEVENEKDAAWSLVVALKSELTNLQRRLVQAEFQFNQALRNRGEIRKKLGVN